MAGMRLAREIRQEWHIRIMKSVGSNNLAPWRRIDMRTIDQVIAQCAFGGDALLACAKEWSLYRPQTVILHRCDGGGFAAYERHYFSSTDTSYTFVKGTFVDSLDRESVKRIIEKIASFEKFETCDDIADGGYISEAEKFYNWRARMLPSGWVFLPDDGDTPVESEAGAKVDDATEASIGTGRWYSPEA